MSTGTEIKKKKLLQLIIKLENSTERKERQRQIERDRETVKDK